MPLSVDESAFPPIKFFLNEFEKKFKYKSKEFINHLRIKMHKSFAIKFISVKYYLFSYIFSNNLVYHTHMKHKDLKFVTEQI